MCFNPSPVRRVPSPNRYIAVTKFCFCKNNKRLIINRVPDPPPRDRLGVTYLPFTISSDSVDQTLAMPIYPVFSVCSVYYQPNSSRRGNHCHGPQRAALSGLWAIPSTESGPQPLLVTYNLSSLALTPGEPTPYVCMYVSMVCGMYVGMYWVRRESTQVHREGGTVSPLLGPNRFTPIQRCVYYCRTYYKAVRGGGRRRVEDMCYERRRA